MAKIQIEESVFFLLYRKYILKHDLAALEENTIKFELDDKMNRILARQFYTDYKTANADEKEQALQNYIRSKKGEI
jgi:hypothetical protein